MAQARLAGTLALPNCNRQFPRRHRHDSVVFTFISVFIFIIFIFIRVVFGCPVVSSWSFVVSYRAQPLKREMKSGRDTKTKMKMKRGRR